MYPLERCHRLSRDLDWLPHRLRLVRWTVAGSIWGGLAGAMAVSIIASHGLALIFAKGLLLAAVGGAYAGDRAARAVMQQQLRQLARGALPLPELAEQPEGELVHLRGRVKPRTSLPGFLHGAPAVYRRMIFVLDGTRLVHEAAVDFALVDDSGEEIAVSVAGARLLAPAVERLDYPDTIRFLELPLPEDFARQADRLRARIADGRPLTPVPAGEFLVREGDFVEVVGYKTRVVDPSVALRLERDVPLRAALRSGRTLPLLISLPAPQ